MDSSLFPRGEEWGTGDEALDQKLSRALDQVIKKLDLESITHFYHSSLEIKTRAYNPAFKQMITDVTKGLLYWKDPLALVDQEFVKVQGLYCQKVRREFKLAEANLLKTNLIDKKYFRYEQQIDFSLIEKQKTERNPYVRSLLNRAQYELHSRILMKDLELYLSGEKSKASYENPFYHSLKEKEVSLYLEGLMEIWFDRGQLFVIGLFI